VKNVDVLVPGYLVSHSARIWFGFGHGRSYSFDTCTRGFRFFCGMCVIMKLLCEYLYCVSLDIFVYDTTISLEYK